VVDVLAAAGAVVINAVSHGQVAGPHR
jgi:hypothetical protein